MGSDGIYIRGNCRSKSKLPGQYTSATGLFCYVSGTALCSCRDVQRSQSVTDNYGRPRYYSFEAVQHLQGDNVLITDCKIMAMEISHFVLHTDLDPDLTVDLVVDLEDWDQDLTVDLVVDLED